MNEKVNFNGIKKSTGDNLKINIEYNQNVSLKEIMLQEFEKEIINSNHSKIFTL